MPTSRWVCASLLLVSCLFASTALAVPGDVPLIIESFIAKQFPGASSHFWVLNAAQWQTVDEMIVDFNAEITTKAGGAPSLHRYLLLIVAGRLAGAQSVPVDAAIECSPETT